MAGKGSYLGVYASAFLDMRVWNAGCIRTFLVLCYGEKTIRLFEFSAVLTLFLFLFSRTIYGKLD